MNTRATVAARLARPLPAGRAEPGTPARGTEGGFSLVELVIAMLILTVGVLGLAGTTAYVVREVDAARVNGERAAAVQSAVEYVRSRSYDDIVEGELEVGRYRTSWTTVQGRNEKTVSIVTVGPGATTTTGGSPVIRSEVADTFRYQLVQP